MIDVKSPQRFICLNVCMIMMGKIDNFGTAADGEASLADALRAHIAGDGFPLSLIHISEPTRPY